MQNKMSLKILPEHIQAVLSEEEGKQYLVFSSGESYSIQGVYSPNQKKILYGLPKEYSKLGTALVDAIWFCHPVKLLLLCGQEVYWSEVDVYKCHIAGPWFTDNLLRIRKKTPRGDIASSWELHPKIWEKTNANSFQKEIMNAMSESEGSFLEEVHLDLKLR